MLAKTGTVPLLDQTEQTWRHRLPVSIMVAGALMTIVWTTMVIGAVCQVSVALIRMGMSL